MREFHQFCHGIRAKNKVYKGTKVPIISAQTYDRRKGGANMKSHSCTGLVVNCSTSGSNEGTNSAKTVEVPCVGFVDDDEGGRGADRSYGGWSRRGNFPREGSSFRLSKAQPPEAESGSGVLAQGEQVRGVTSQTDDKPEVVAGFAERMETKYKRRLDRTEKAALTEADGSSSSFPTTGLYGKMGMIEWIIDTGCSHHITGNESCLLNVNEVNPCPVGLPDGKTVVAIKEGSVRLTDTIVLRNVLFVPKLQCNLISVSQLNDDLHCFVHFTSDSCVIRDNSSRVVIGTGWRRDGLYHLQRKPTVQTFSVARPKSLELWHHRLGHPSEKVESGIVYFFQFEIFWGFKMADASTMTDTSTDDGADDQNLRFESNILLTSVASNGNDKSRVQKNLRRLAQNREAARKSRLRKKAYVQQLESSRMKLTQLEQELQRARQQGIFISSSGDQAQSIGGNGALTFDVEYARWLEDHNRRINELRGAVNSHAGDGELRIIVEGITTQYDDIFRLKGDAAKTDVFHILSGMWKTPAERCFLWLGGFRSSELLKLLTNHLEPLTEQQLLAMNNLQQSSQQAEDALSQGMEALQQSLAETLAGSLGPSSSSGNVANYMGQMAMAMGKLGTLEGFIRQADNLRQQTLQQMHRILTTRQSARALLAISDYFSRLRALSSLWLARPRE